MKRTGCTNLDIEDAMSPQTDQPQLTVPEGHRVHGSPFQVGEMFHVDHIDLGPQGTVAAPRHRENLGEQGEIASFQGVATGPKGITGLALIKEDSGLTVPNGQLRPPLDLTRPLFRKPMH